MEEDDLIIELDDVKTTENTRVTGIPRKGCSNTIKSCFTSYGKRKRPTIMPITFIFFVVGASGVFCLAPGIIGLYKSSHMIRTNYTVFKYTVEAFDCTDGTLTYPVPWTVYVYGSWRLPGDIRFWQGYLIKICGPYADNAYNKAVNKYPVDTKIAIWAWDSNHDIVTLDNPEDLKSFFNYGIFCASLLIFGSLVQSITVIFFGFNAFTKLFKYRYRDPYKVRQ